MQCFQDWALAWAHMLAELGAKEPEVLQAATCHYKRMLEWCHRYEWRQMYQAA